MDNQFRCLIEDLKRWQCTSFRDYFYAFFEQAIWVTIFYRISRALFLVDIPIIKVFLRLIAFFMFKFSEVFLGVAIRPVTSIGPGLYISHTGVIRINPDVVAGKNLSIGPGVILGQRGLGRKGAPCIGDNVYIGLGCKVLGAVKIGNNVRIGANAVVVKDIPDGATAVGVPAKVVKMRDC